MSLPVVRPRLAKCTELAKNKQTQALRYIAKVEALIAEEHAKGSADTERNDKGQFVKSEAQTCSHKRG